MDGDCKGIEARRRAAAVCFVRLLIIIAAGLAEAELEPMGSKRAWTLKTLHGFCSQSRCADGAYTGAGLLRDGAGNLYGTTWQGGAHSEGTVFELTPRGTDYRYRVLYDFCALANCTDGGAPRARLIIDVNGNLYGTTATGGNGPFSGTAFELIPNAERTKWKFKVLYEFCSANSCADGYSPWWGLTYQGAESGAPYDGVSPLYGTTTQGGSTDMGVAFRLNFIAGKIRRKQTVIHDFCSGCDEGSEPRGELSFDASGNLYGTAASGGSGQGGVAFRLSPVNNKFVETVLYSFCRLSECADGHTPLSGMTRDAKGNFYGTTDSGGANNQGVAFELLLAGVNHAREIVLHSFCSAAGCMDGEEPNAGLEVAPDGVLIGMTPFGGAFDGGLVFSLNGTTQTTLYDFCSLTGCKDGSAPAGSVVMDASGNLFGTTSGGGPSGDYGTVFELSP